MPNFGTLMSGPNAGEVAVMIKTVASGVNSSQHRFRFIITPIASGITGEEMDFPFPDYQSGQFETILVQGLQRGKNYIFSGVSANIFGRSEAAYSASILLEGLYLHTKLWIRRSMFPLSLSLPPSPFMFVHLHVCLLPAVVLKGSVFPITTPISKYNLSIKGRQNCLPTVPVY